MWREHLGEPHALGAWIQMLSGQHVGNISRTVLAAAGNLAGLLLLLLFMLITLFFVYKDGAHIAGQLDRVGEHLLPERWQRFSRVVPATVSATVTGMGLIAIGEGVVLGVAYWIAGVPSPVLQAMMSSAPTYQLGTGTDSNGRSANAYLAAPVVAPSPVIVYENTYISEPCCAVAPPVYSTYPSYYYYAPYATGIVVRRGVSNGWSTHRPPYGWGGSGRGTGVDRPSRPASPPYAGKPVGVRPQQPVAAPRAVPSRPRP